MIYGIPEQTNNTPQPGTNFYDVYINPSLQAFLKGFEIYMNAKYGLAQTQQVMNNPTSDYSNQMFQLYLMTLQNQNQQSSNDDWLKYVAIGAVAVAAVMALTQSNTKKR